MILESHCLDSIVLPDLKIAKKVSLYRADHKAHLTRVCVNAVSQADLVAIMVLSRLLKTEQMPTKCMLQYMRVILVLNICMFLKRITYLYCIYH